MYLVTDVSKTWFTPVTTRFKKDDTTMKTYIIFFDTTGVISNVKAEFFLL